MRDYIIITDSAANLPKGSKDMDVIVLNNPSLREVKETLISVVNSNKNALYVPVSDTSLENYGRIGMLCNDINNALAYEGSMLITHCVNNRHTTGDIGDLAIIYSIRKAIDYFQKSKIEDGVSV